MLQNRFRVNLSGYATDLYITELVANELCNDFGLNGMARTKSCYQQVDRDQGYVGSNVLCWKIILGKERKMQTGNNENEEKYRECKPKTPISFENQA